MEYTKSCSVFPLRLPPLPTLYPKLANLITPMKSTKVRTHEDHALLLLPETATLSQMEHKSMPRFLNVLSPLENLQRKRKTAVSRTNSAFIVATLVICCEPVKRRDIIFSPPLNFLRMKPTSA